MNDEEKTVKPSAKPQKSLSQKFTALPGCLRFFLGAIPGVILSVCLWWIIYPPSGPEYGEGIGWGMILIMLVIPAGLSIGGIIGLIWGAKVY